MFSCTHRFFHSIYKIEQHIMNTDFALRKQHSGQVGKINVLHSTYQPSNTPSNAFIRGCDPHDMANYAKPIGIENPNKELANPLFPKESDTNPAFREKYKLPKKQASLWFDQTAYISYP